jgi:phytoene dehydrogenase-like protein
MTANDYLVGLHWHDVIVIGAGADGLACALTLARRGLKVIVLEEREALGGAIRTERPFTQVPALATPTGGTLHGAAPVALLAELEIDPPTLARDPHDFLPSAAGPSAGYACFGSRGEEAHGSLDGGRVRRMLAAIGGPAELAARGSSTTVRGGLGTIARMMADLAIKHGAILETERTVSSLVVESGVAKGVVLKDGTVHHASAIVRTGSDQRASVSLLNLALRGLPRFACWPDGAFARAGFAPTIHLVPQANEHPEVEWTISTAIDPSLQDPGGHHDSAFVVHGAAGVHDVIAIAERFAPGLRDLVVDSFVEPPQASDLGEAHAQGLHACTPASAWALGAAGHEAALRVMKEIGRA